MILIVTPNLLNFYCVCLIFYESCRTHVLYPRVSLCFLISFHDFNNHSNHCLMQSECQRCFCLSISLNAKAQSYDFSPLLPFVICPLCPLILFYLDFFQDRFRDHLVSCVCHSDVYFPLSIDQRLLKQDSGVTPFIKGLCAYTCNHV